MTLSEQQIEVLSKIDHTLLLPTATESQIEQIAAEGQKYKTASICIPPSFVSAIHRQYSTLNICTVIGFPLGYNTTKVKEFETATALQNGANEIDMVINIGLLKNKQYDQVEAEIVALKKIAGNKILKVIIETAYLDENEKIEMCKIVTNSGADYIKTSTGFAPSGATFADVELFTKYIGPNVKIKAAGGMKTYDDMVKFIELGASRLGTSSGLKLVLSEI